MVPEPARPSAVYASLPSHIDDEAMEGTASHHHDEHSLGNTVRELTTECEEALISSSGEQSTETGRTRWSRLMYCAVYGCCCCNLILSIVVLAASALLFIALVTVASYGRGDAPPLLEEPALPLLPSCAIPIYAKEDPPGGLDEVNFLYGFLTDNVPSTCHCGIRYRPYSAFELDYKQAAGKRARLRSAVNSELPGGLGSAVGQDQAATHRLLQKW